MCRRITCSKCGKPSFAGCGAHVEQVLADVPKEERCKCAPSERGARGGTTATLLKGLVVAAGIGAAYLLLSRG